MYRQGSDNLLVYIEDVNIIDKFLTSPKLDLNHYVHPTKGYHLLHSICNLHVVAVSRDM